MDEFRDLFIKMVMIKWFYFIEGMARREEEAKMLRSLALIWFESQKIWRFLRVGRGIYAHAFIEVRVGSIAAKIPNRLL